MNTLRSLSRFGLAAIAIVSSIGCGGSDDNESSKPASTNTNTAVADAKTVLAPIEAAFSSPSGSLDAASAKAVFGAYQAQGSAGGALSFIPGGAAAPSTQGASGGAACIATGAANATIDLDCMSGGETTGKLTYSVGQDAGFVYITFAYDNVCEKSGASCINGKGAEKVALGGQGDMVLSGELDITAGGETKHVSYGVRLHHDAGSTSYEWVVFDGEGKSYTLTAKVGGESGELTVTGANGSFTCTYTGETGTCKGSDGKSFSW